MLLKDKGELARAEELLSEAVAAMKETIGDTHPDGLICKSNLGTLYKVACPPHPTLNPGMPSSPHLPWCHVAGQG